MKPPPRTLKRRRFQDEVEEKPKKPTKTIKLRLRPSKETKTKSSPPASAILQTPSQSSDEVVTQIASKEVNNQENKPVPESQESSVEETRTVARATAFRNAMEILVEIANRDRHRATVGPFQGFGGQLAYHPHYANVPTNGYITPYVNQAPSTHLTPYANSTSPNYITPYVDPLPINPINQANNKNASKNPVRSCKEAREESCKPAQYVDQTGRNSVEPDTNTDNNLESAQYHEDSPMSLGLLDGFLALANGGKLPGNQDGLQDGAGKPFPHDSMLSAPPSPADTIAEVSCRPDGEIQALVELIAKDLSDSDVYPSQSPQGTTYGALYSSMNGRQLGFELKRLIAVAEPEVNTLISKDQAQAIHLLYTHLLSREQTRHAAVQNANHPSTHTFPNGMSQWGPVVYLAQPPNYGTSVFSGSWPSQAIAVPAPEFVPRANIIAPRPANNLNQEHRLAENSFPPAPSSRLTLRSGAGRSRKKRES